MNAAAPTATPAYDTVFLHTPRAASRWPVLIFRWGRLEAEIDGPFCGFLRLGRIETYSRWEQSGAWMWQREPGAIEISLGRYRVTVSRSPEA